MCEDQQGLEEELDKLLEAKEADAAALAVCAAEMALLQVRPYSTSEITPQIRGFNQPRGPNWA
jgi:hypothetical protein